MKTTELTITFEIVSNAFVCECYYDSPPITNLIIELKEKGKD